jgi:chemotaxis methyl-accepting protein methylase
LTPLLRVFGRRARPVSLVSPRLRRRAEIEIVEDDITVPGRFPAGFDVIRVANLVQRAYFDEPTLRTIVVNLRERLRDGGLLVICRTTEAGVNDATIFRRTGGRFTAEASLNGGAEVRDLVLAL